MTTYTGYSYNITTNIKEMFGKYVRISFINSRDKKYRYKTCTDKPDEKVIMIDGQIIQYNIYQGFCMFKCPDNKESYMIVFQNIKTIQLLTENDWIRARLKYGR